MTDILRPRRGSMAFRPRKRAATQAPSVFWPMHPTKRILGFAGYKVGMTHMGYLDQRSDSPTKGQEISSAATVVEVPPLRVYGLRYYDAQKSIGDILTEDAAILKMLNMKKPKAKKEVKTEDVKDIRLLVFAQPDKTRIGKKHIERMELGIGGKDTNEKMEFAKSFIGKELRIADAFKPGEYIDAIAITKGKGWQGAIKRFGTAKQRRKATGKVRHVGTLGQWHPAYVLYTVPQAGQTGYHTRTELNKQILKMGSNIDEINPNGGFPHYGFIKNDYVILKGSLPGPYKRLVKLRLALRSPEVQEPKVAYIAQR